MRKSNASTQFVAANGAARPWYVCEVDDRIIADASGLVVADMRIRSPQDAKLIAAAPDLLEALKGMYARYATKQRDDVEAMVLKMAEDAISKAEGRA